MTSNEQTAQERLARGRQIAARQLRASRVDKVEATPEDHAIFYRLVDRLFLSEYHRGRRQIIGSAVVRYLETLNA